MKVSRDDLTPELIKTVLSYDPNTGWLTWISKHHSKRILLGARAGSDVPSTGYRSINLFGRSYAEHILIWFMQTGEWPTGQIDHENHQRNDNRWANLKEVTFIENMRNRTAKRDSITGHQGIWFNKRRNRYVAEIAMNGKKVYQQSFTSATEAKVERNKKLIELGFHENHGAEHN